MNGQNIIDLFDVLTDGLSELTAAQKLSLANRKYKKLANERDWDDLRTAVSVAISSGYFNLASDFKKFVPNEEGQRAEYKNVFYIGTTPHPIVRMAERMKFNGLPYYDPSLGSYGRVITPSNLDGQTATYDYFKSVTDLATNTSPVFRNTDNHSIIAYMMAVEHYSIDQSESGRSKEEQYQGTVEDMLEDMEYDDSKLKEAGVDHA